MGNRRKNMKNGMTALPLMVFLMMLPVSANAITITSASIGDSFDIFWAKSPIGDLPHTLSAKATFTIADFTATDLLLGIKIWNTSPDPDTESPEWNQAILSFGMGVDPNVIPTMATIGSIFDNVETPSNGNFPGGFKEIDVCVFAANNCSGGNINLGLGYQGYDSFSINLKGNFGSVPTAVLQPFPIKFQTAKGSFEFDGGEGEEPAPFPVPEPTSLLLLGAGLAALGLLAKNKR